MAYVTWDAEDGIAFRWPQGDIGYLDTVDGDDGEKILVAVFGDDVVELGESGKVH